MRSIGDLFWWNSLAMLRTYKKVSCVLLPLMKVLGHMVLTLFRSAKHSTRTVAVPSAQGRTVRAQGRTVRGLVRGAVVLSAQGRTVRGLGPDGPRPGALLGLLSDGRTVRTYAGTAEDRRRRLDLAPGRDPVGE
jgi:hypothetical protein